MIKKVNTGPILGGYGVKGVFCHYCPVNSTLQSHIVTLNQLEQ